MINYRNWLTRCGEEGQDDDPVDKEEDQDDEGPQRLEEEDGDISQTLARLVEQRHCQTDPFPHHQDHQQQNYLQSRTYMCTHITLPAVELPTKSYIYTHK